MNKLCVIYLLLFVFSTNIFSQNALVFNKKITVQKNANKVGKDLLVWFDGISNFRKLSEASDPSVIKGKGVIEYKNQIQFEESKALSKSYQEKTNGLITFDILIEVKDGECIFTLSNFLHEPSDKVDNFNFGIITDEKTIPERIFCEVSPEWCNNVWLDMKQKIETRVNELFISIPTDL